MLVLWNKVSSTFPYLTDVRSDIGKEQVRVWRVRSLDLLQILTFCVLIRGNSWFTFDVAISTSSLSQLYNKVWHLQNFVLIVKDCQRWVATAVFKVLCWWGCLEVFLFFVVSSVRSSSFDKQWTTEGRRPPIWSWMNSYFLEEVVLCLIVRLLYWPLFSLWYMNCKTLFWVSFLSKIKNRKRL